MWLDVTWEEGPELDPQMIKELLNRAYPGYEITVDYHSCPTPHARMEES